jgi:ribonuclease HI
VKLVVHVDGGSRGNPGPAAAAAVTSTPDGEVIDEASATLGHATNNVAEYRGLLLGLERARELGATEVEVINDSELVAKQVNGEYRVKKPEMAALHAQAMSALAGFERWSIRPVPRAQNAAADALVNRALDEADEASQPRIGSDEEGSEYAGYLRIDDLLRLQQPITPGAHAELAFIIVHQSRELWFKLVLHELGLAREQLEAGRPQGAIRPLRRTIAVERLLLDHFDVLEALGPEDFPELRDPLAPGLGSQQFRAIESESPSLYDAFAACAGLPDGDERLEALADLYRDHLGDPRRALLYEVAELLLDHDEQIALWRHHQALTAARGFGSRPGSGGPRGAGYPRGTHDERLYPDLWAVRAAL